MTAATWFVGWLVLGQVSTLPVPVSSPGARRFGQPPVTIVASPTDDAPLPPADDGLRSVLTSRELGGDEIAAPPSDTAPPGAVEPISAQPIRHQPTAAPPPSPNPPGQRQFAAALPASASQPLGQAPAVGQGLAKRLVTQAFPSATSDSASAANLSLRAALATTTDRARQLAIIKTYWEASSLVADWQFAREELQLVDELAAPRSAADQAALAAAQTAAQARLVEAEMASITARYALGDAAVQAGDEPPLPADVPFVGRYRTEYDTIFAGRVAPLGAKRIHATLPLRRELVDARAAAVVAGVNSLDEHIGAYRSGQAALAQVLSSMISLRLQRGAFLGAVRDYNLDIAEYALAAAQPSDPPEKIVAMLIEVEPGEETRSVLVPPQMAAVVEPANGSFATPAQLGTPASLAPALSPAATPSAPAVLNRPTTQRVLGNFRDVIGQVQPAELQVRPRSSFGAGDEQNELPPSLPPP